MENILEIRNLDEYDYSNIKLSSPSVQAGNNYYTNITIGDIDKHLYIQFPKCSTKAGYVKNNSKSYTDLIFSASDTRIIKWLENLETYLQNEIYKRRELWFDTEISLDDIQELMTPIMRSYKSGKNVLIRCNIKNHKCSVYDENEVLFDLEKFTTDREIIPLVSINGVKFSSRNFAIEFNLSQIMIISSKDELEKNCLIKSSSIQKSRDKKPLSTNNEIILPVSNKPTDNVIDIDGDTINSLGNDIKNLESVTLNVQSDEDTKEHQEEHQEEHQDDNNILLNISDKIESLHPESKKDNSVVSSQTSVLDNDADILDEIDLDSLDIEESSLDVEKSSDDKINIKDPQEIYYEIYKNALVKANTLKRNTIEAFLNAKNIKSKYNLEDLDLELDLDLQEDLTGELDLEQ
jgi:hypothetical protein